jgi:hypothetical protein
MCSQGTALIEGSTANVTHVGSLARVDSFMFHQHRLGCEGFRATRTRKWFFSSMRSYVNS